MTTTTTFSNVEVRNQTRGRKTSTKTAKVRRSILKVLAESNGEMTTKDIAKATKQSKVRVIAALRWAEQNDLVVRVGTAKHEGRGRPMATWSV